jgi:hypothetical protein
VCDKDAYVPIVRQAVRRLRCDHELTCHVALHAVGEALKFAESFAVSSVSPTLLYFLHASHCTRVLLSSGLCDAVVLQEAKRFLSNTTTQDKMKYQGRPYNLQFHI